MLSPGDLVDGKYRIEQLLGEGGMGSVFRATHLTMRREVAIKIMRPEVASDPAMAARFEREALASSRIRSPHVVLTYDFGHVPDGPLYLVMELLDGESLASRLDREPLTPRETVRIAALVCRALAAAHEAGVVHRDLKPDNVFLCRDGTMKVVDFGIARVLEGDPQEVSALTVAGSFVGTPHYMSPEACGTGAVGPAADLYSLGVLLFEALTGTVPFHDDQLVLLMGMHVRVPPERVREVREDLEIPDMLEELVDHLLAKAPTERPSALEALRILEALDWASARTVDTDATLVSPATPPLTASAPVVAAPTIRSEQGPASPVVPSATQSAPPRRGATLAAVAAASLVLVGLGAIAFVTLVAPRAPSGPMPAPDTVPRPDSIAPSTGPLPATVPVEPPIHPAQPPESSSSAPSPRTVTFRFERSPSNARIVEDGAPVDDVLEVVADGRPHRFVVTAPGYQRRELSVVADQDRVVRATLRRRASPDPRGEQLLEF